MNDDVSTTESDQPMSEDSAAGEPEEPMVDASPEAADEGGEDGGGAGMLGEIEIPSTGRLLVGVGGAVMAVSTLLSWLKVGQDSFPNVTGVGVSTIGVGLAVFLVGLSLLLRRKSVGATLGMALGAFAITLIFIVLIGTDRNILGFGVWLGLAGTAVAVLGALQTAYESNDQPTLELLPMQAALGAALAVVASFWLDWVEGPINGLDLDVLFGLPVLILGGLALVLTVELLSIPLLVLGGRRQALLTISQAAGVAITVIAGSNVLAVAVLGSSAFGSAPIVALVGGIMLTRSIRQTPNQ